MPIAFPPTLYFRAPLMSGDAGVEQTINQMRAEVDEALADSFVVRKARDIVANAPQFDDYSEARALYDWVRQHVRFTKDPVNKEVLMKPGDLLRWIEQDGRGAGDCDDISMLLGTLLMAVGYPARLMTVAAHGDEFSHVYVEAQISGQWVPLDPARYDSEFGVAPPAFTRARWWSLADLSHGDLSGTKVFVQPGATAHVHLGDYRRFRSHVSGMGSYGRVRTMGDGTTASGDSTSSTIATIEQGTADIIRASRGQPASPFDWSSSGPWASFQTQYSPYGVPGGYVTQQPDVSIGTSRWGLWLVLGLGALLLLGGRR